MTLTMQPENSLILEVRDTTSVWAVYEHWAVLNAGDPPTCIMVGATKLVDVFKMVDGKNNSEWTRMFANGGSVMVRIIATGKDRRAAINEAIRQSRKYDPMPICNLRGYTLGNGLKRIICSDGRVFDTQMDAAVALGVSQSAISRHLRGDHAHVKGLLLSYQGVE